MLLQLERGSADGNGYETWTPKLRRRILKVLGEVDVYEYSKNTSCLPDHKFSEIRWDGNTKTANNEDMSDLEIGEKFQLLSNQRNQQKREVCRNCFQTNKRGYPFNIKFYYQGNENWDLSIPKTGILAEEGCKGCGWYDMAKWRSALDFELNK